MYKPIAEIIHWKY